MFCSHNTFICVWISEQTAIISLHNIDYLVFIAEKQGVYCAVRAESLNIIQASILLQGSKKEIDQFVQNGLEATHMKILETNLMYVVRAS